MTKYWNYTLIGIAIATGVELALSFMFYGTKSLKYSTANQPRGTPGLVEKDPERVTAQPVSHKEPAGKRQETEDVSLN